MAREALGGHLWCMENDGDEIPAPTPIASVKVWIDINGIEYTIEKTAEAKFTKNRSKNEYVKSNSVNCSSVFDKSIL